MSPRILLALLITSGFALPALAGEEWQLLSRRVQNGQNYELYLQKTNAEGQPVTLDLFKIRRTDQEGQVFGYEEEGRVTTGFSTTGGGGSYVIGFTLTESPMTEKGGVQGDDFTMTILLDERLTGMGTAASPLGADCQVFLVKKIDLGRTAKERFVRLSAPAPDAPVFSYHRQYQTVFPGSPT